LNYLFVMQFKLGHQYLALSTSITAALNMALLFYFMSKYANGIGGRKLLATCMKLGLSALVMAGICWAAQVTVLAGWVDYAFWLRCLVLSLTIGLAAIAYFGCNMLLKNEEVDDFLGGLRRRVKRRAA